MPTKTYEGMCPRCYEYTEVTIDDNGCCNAGCEHEGSIIHSDEIEPDKPIETKDQK